MKNESILTEAESIVNGERAADYGSAHESFRRIGAVTGLISNTDDTPAIRACKTLIAVKLIRESHKHKRDNLVDLCGYAELLNRLHEDQN
jgi:hypothetical protein